MGQGNVLCRCCPGSNKKEATVRYRSFGRHPGSSSGDTKTSMSISGPSRRAVGRCTRPSSTHAITTLTPRAGLFCQTLPIRPRVPLHHHQQRRAAASDSGSNKNNQSVQDNPYLEEFQRKNPNAANVTQSQARPSAGDLPASSIFEDDRRAQIQQEQASAATNSTDQDSSDGNTQTRDPNNMLRVLDPDPNSRERWERKKVIQMVRRGGRLTDQQVIKRTEREHLVKSQNFKTSVKKLGMLARQIQGKTIEDAIVQMRFSKKKIAAEIMKQLEYARDEAVVMRGMGLGNIASDETPAALNLPRATTTRTTSTTATPPPSSSTPKTPTQIQLKSGQRHTITNPSQIYIDQAWVGRGPFGQLPDYRARGQTNILRTPWTSLTVLLKEEATRVREFSEREAKRRREAVGKKLWVPLPDRPVQWQRQWYCF